MPFPILPSTICEYLDWKVYPPTQAMKAFSTHDDIYDTNHRVIVGTGTWRAKVNIQRFHAAMALFHNFYDHTGPYQHFCDECVRINDEFKNSPKYTTGFHGSCSLRSGSSRIVPKGNPLSSRDVMAHIKRTRDFLKNWKVMGNVQLLPGEIRQLRRYLICSGSVANLQVYVMILLGIKLFLRADELINMKVEDFVPSYQVFTNGKLVKALPLKIKGMFFFQYLFFYPFLIQ
jgi:integrase